MKGKAMNSLARVGWSVSVGVLLAMGAVWAPAPAWADNVPKVIKKVPPEFPEEATRKKISEGVIKAKLTVDGGGSVTNVEVVDASPPKAKVFSEAAISALSKWKFEATGKGESFEIKLVFSEE
jgi:protein TonB